MIIGIDVDDVCADLLSEWLRRYYSRVESIFGAGNKKAVECQRPLIPEDITGWDLEGQVEHENILRSILQDYDLYDHISPIPGSRGAVREFRKAGHRVIFISSCTPGTIDQKLRWLLKYGFLEGDKDHAHEDFFAVKDKSLVNADILIDDNVTNVEKFPRKALLVTQPHNQNIKTDRIRIPNLAAAPRFIEVYGHSIANQAPSIRR